MLKYFVVSFKSRNSNNLLESVDIVDSQRQQAEERAQKMKSVLLKTKKELSEAKKQVRCTPYQMPVFFSIFFQWKESTFSEATHL